METIAQKELRSQEELVKPIQRDAEEYGERVDPQEFWEEIGRSIRQGIRITLEKTINREFSQFIGALEYERSPRRKDVRNGHRSRDFGTVYGVIEDIQIPRARKSSFTTWILPRFKRRSGRIGRLISQIFLRGLSTRDIKKISKHIYGENYSPSLVSRFNKELGEALSLWLNRPIERKIKYLYLDGVNLSLKRDRASREALLCCVGITGTGNKEFLDFLLGGRESQVSWENLLLRLKKRGLTDKQLSLITVDGNPGLLAALKTCFPEVKVQRCTVHKLRNISNHCPRAIQARIMADVKKVIYATSKKEALEEFASWKSCYDNLAPKAVRCLEKDLAETLRFFDFPYRMWVSLRTTNIIERVFREFRRRTKVMDAFPTEESCIRIMFSLVQMINDDWKTKPMKNFR
jgi:putative transposase